MPIFSRFRQEAPGQQKAVAEPSETTVKEEKQEESVECVTTDGPIPSTTAALDETKVLEKQGGMGETTENPVEAKTSGATATSPATKGPTATKVSTTAKAATKAPATAKVPTATKAPAATKQPTAGKAPEKTPAKTRQPAATQKPTATKVPPAETKAPATKAPAASPSPTKKGHYEKVWVVDRQAETVVEDVYEEKDHIICNGCGADITDCQVKHLKAHAIAGEKGGFHVEVERIKTGQKVTEIPEKGHWEKVWVED